ncbi:MAG TPA: hypothetical protein VEK57_23320 [Thermoanaerobaculia bacterium]|nr:hypothetical protein [Thermoanaerobaculia bacterium]
MFLVGCALSLALLSPPQRAASPAEYAILHGSAVVTKTSAHEIAIVVNAYREEAQADRLADHVFRFWTEAEVPEIALTSRAASIEFRGDELIVVAADRQWFIALTVGDNRQPPAAPGGFTASRLVGYGLNHETGPAVNRMPFVEDPEVTTGRVQQVDHGDGTGAVGSCDAGGRGSTSCSLTSVTSSCSVSCTSGFYACCKYAPENTCKCIKY